MHSMLVQQSRHHCLELIETYDGKLGKHFLKAMVLSMERQAKQSVGYDTENLLIGVYFHELGRLKSEERDHTQHSVDFFEDFIKDKQVSERTKEIVRDCCYNHRYDGVPYTKEGTFVKNWHAAIAFEPETLLARLEDLQDQGNDYEQAKAALFDGLAEEATKITDEKMKSEAKETLRLLRESLE